MEATVKTPSEILSKIASVEAGEIQLLLMPRPTKSEDKMIKSVEDRQGRGGFSRWILSPLM
jgi:hypothetical protein